MMRLMLLLRMIGKIFFRCVVITASAFVVASADSLVKNIPQLINVVSKRGLISASWTFMPCGSAFVFF